MSNSFNKIIWILCMLVLTFSCRSSESIEVDCKGITEAPEGFEKYFIFNKGTWWEYELLGTNETDRIEVIYLIKESFNVSASVNFGIVPCCYRYKSVRNHSNPRFLNKRNESQQVFDVTADGDSSSWVVVHSTKSKVFGEGVIGTWPLKEKNSIGYYQIDSLEANVTINGNTSLKCLKFKRTKSSSDSGHIESAYFSKGIVLVKYTITPNQTWQLKKYEIK